MILASVFELYSGFDRGGFGTGPGLRVNHSWSDGFGSTMAGGRMCSFAIWLFSGCGPV